MCEFWNSVLVEKCKKSYHCEHCYADIKMGTSYYRETGKANGEFNDYALCLRCHDLLISGNPLWALEDEELGEFHEKFVNTKFAVCPKCGIGISDFHYSDDKLNVELECNCGNKYTVDLSSENLLKLEEK